MIRLKIKKIGKFNESIVCLLDSILFIPQIDLPDEAFANGRQFSISIDHNYDLANEIETDIDSLFHRKSIKLSR